MKASNWEIMANPPLNDKRYIEIVTTRPSPPPSSQSVETRPSGALPSESLQIISRVPRDEHSTGTRRRSSSPVVEPDLGSSQARSKIGMRAQELAFWDRS
jgi:hypothetical protein